MLYRSIWFVYIIECLDSTYYVGCTSDLEGRYDQHLRNEGSNYTRRHGVKALVYWEEYDSIEEAWLREHQLKDWSQAKKKMLIGGIWKQSWDKKKL